MNAKNAVAKWFRNLFRRNPVKEAHAVTGPYRAQPLTGPFGTRGAHPEAVKGYAPPAYPSRTMSTEEAIAAGLLQPLSVTHVALTSTPPDPACHVSSITSDSNISSYDSRGYDSSSFDTGSPD